MKVKRQNFFRYERKKTLLQNVVGSCIMYPVILSAEKRRIRIMHKYLRAIGFSKYIAKKDIRYLLDQVIEDPTSSLLLRGESGQCGYLDKSFGDGFGIRLFGEYDENDRFDIEYYFPYIESNILSST